MSEKHSTNGKGKLHEDRKLAVALYRISDHRQDSLPTQRAWAQRVTQRDGATLASEFEDEGFSGSDVSRPGLEQMVAFVKERFYARDPILYLLVIDLDRFLRRDSLSTGAWLEELRKHGLRYVITTAQRFDLYSPLDRTLIALSSDFTREPELRAKSNHVLNGMAERARKGQWIGGPTPLGYLVGPDRHLILGPEEEQEVVRWIFATYASGRLTAHGIARELTARSIRTRWSKNGKWSRNTVLAILSSRTYLGCLVWGKKNAGKYHRIQAGMVVPRDDKEQREQQQMLKQLKNLPVQNAETEDCIIVPNAHPALIDLETFEACQRRREENRRNLSCPRATLGRKGNVWPLAGQMKCGHCGLPVWTLPIRDVKGKHKGTYVERARICCSGRWRDPDACPASNMAQYLEALQRSVNLLRERLADPAAVAEMERELQRQQQEHAHTARVDRPKLVNRIAALDDEIARATRSLLQFPDDLKADAFEALRGLKTQRDALGQQLRDLDARQRDEAPLDPLELKETLEMVRNLSARWETQEEAELLRATLRDIVKEVRLYFRPRRDSDPKPPRGRAAARLIGHIEVELTPSVTDLLNTGIRISSKFCPLFGPMKTG